MKFHLTQNWEGKEVLLMLCWVAFFFPKKGSVLIIVTLLDVFTIKLTKALAFPFYVICIFHHNHVSSWANIIPALREQVKDTVFCSKKNVLLIWNKSMLQLFSTSHPPISKDFTLRMGAYANSQLPFWIDNQFWKWGNMYQLFLKLEA